MLDLQSKPLMSFTEYDRGEWAVRVKGLKINLPQGGDIVDEVSFDIAKGEVLGLVGESGSGKTTVGMALLGYARGGARIAGGEVWLNTPQGPVNILVYEGAALRRLRGAAVAYVPQDAASALNPALTLEVQLTEVLDAHISDISAAERDQRIREVMADVGLPSDAAFLNRYPHQLSGGQQQRIGIAMAIILRPALIVLDEPTTGLDVSTQNRILTLVRKLCDVYHIGALHVTHDLSVISALADRLMVMYSGRVIELGNVADVFNRPHHPYTQALFCAVPELGARSRLVAISGAPARPGQRPNGCFFAPRCSLADGGCQTGRPNLTICEPFHEVACFKSGRTATPAPQHLPDPAPLTTQPIFEVEDLKVRYGPVPVLKGVNFSVYEGECLAIVGESGSGKSTMSRSLVGLVKGAGRGLRFRGSPLHPNARRRSRMERQKIQYIFQSPFNSLNPRHTIASILGLVYDTFHSGSASDRQKACIRVLNMVGLPTHALALYPDEMSGGERQRASIARALLSEPDILVCDEVTSALDVSVQAAIVNLLKKLMEEQGLTIIFVTHDLALVRNIAHRVLVLENGVVAELGPVGEVIDTPRHPYAQELVRNAQKSDLTLRVATG